VFIVALEFGFWRNLPASGSLWPTNNPWWVGSVLEVSLMKENSGFTIKWKFKVWMYYCLWTAADELNALSHSAVEYRGAHRPQVVLRTPVSWAVWYFELQFRELCYSKLKTPNQLIEALWIGYKFYQRRSQPLDWKSAQNIGSKRWR
jgi:hypothetical protein